MSLPTATTGQIFRYYLSYWARFKVLGLFSFGTAACAYGVDIMAPLYVKQIIDTLTENTVSRQAAADVALPILFSLGILWAVSWILWRVNALLENRFQTRVMSAILGDAFRYSEGHSFRFFSNTFTGGLVRKIGRLSDSFEMLQDILIYQILHLVLTVGGAIIVLATQVPLLALVFFVWAALLLSVHITFGRWKQKYNIDASKKDSAITAALADAFSNHENIRSFASARYEHERFNETVGMWRRAALISWDLDGLINGLNGLFSIIAQAFIFWLLITLWGRGEIQAGDIVLVQTYFFFALLQLFFFGNIIRRYYHAMANAEEGVGILSLPHEVYDAPDPKPFMPQRGEISFEQVSFSFGGKESVLQDFSLHIKDGEKMAFVGSSGAGKSTVMKLLLRLYDIDGGAIRIDGTNIREVKQDDLRSAIALVPQEPILFHRSLMENIRYGRLSASDEEVKEAARHAHCEEFISRLPLGYDTLVGERGIKLSGGERQRIAIARAFLKNAPILILDEATSSLDSESERFIQDALNILMEGKTVLVIAHRLSTIMHMDRIVVLSAGKIIDEGTHAELIAREGIYKTLWSIQAGGFIGE